MAWTAPVVDHRAGHLGVRQSRAGSTPAIGRDQNEAPARELADRRARGPGSKLRAREPLVGLEHRLAISYEAWPSPDRIVDAVPPTQEAEPKREPATRGCLGPEDRPRLAASLQDGPTRGNGVPGASHDPEDGRRAIDVRERSVHVGEDRLRRVTPMRRVAPPAR